ncbi:MAG: hypothetical protein FJX75_00355 [Armatimonadetes bacterium]|nr:hypothetical protein [Armatimonadota bacterium]
MLISILLSATTVNAAGPDDPSPFGIVCPWPKVGETGARWVRCGAGATQLVDWGAVEPEAGRFVWDGADSELVKWDKPEGLTPLPILAYTAPWASSGLDGDRACPPRDLRDYARFVRESVARYKGDIRYWEVWNEENIEFFKGTIPQYVDMLKIASIAARQADPEARVVFGGTAGVDSRFIERCYELGTGPYFDVMAVHPYQWGRTFNDGWNRDKMTRLRSVMDRFGGARVPIWCTEIGWSTGEGVSNEDQARLLVQAFVGNLALKDLGIAKVFWFCVKDWGGPGHGIFADDGSRKPAFEAYRIVTRELEGTVPVGRLDTGDVRCHAFCDLDGQRAVLVFWSPTLEPMPLALPKLGGEFTVVDLNGREQRLTGEQLPQLTATPEPSYLRLPPEALAALLPADATLRPAAYWSPPDRPATPPWWPSVQIPEGTSRLCFVLGETREVSVDLWNLGAEPQQATVTVSLLGEQDRVLAADDRRCPLPADACTPALLSLAVPPGLAPGLTPMVVSLRTEADPRPIEYRLAVRVAQGPTIEFLANSHVERSVYLQPGHESGCSESCRFGKTWTYAFDVPFACEAELQMLLGAHLAGPFAVRYSQDGNEWKTLLDGRGDRAWRQATLTNLQPGKLYLRFAGENVQLDELVLTWVR